MTQLGGEEVRGEGREGRKKEIRRQGEAAEEADTEEGDEKQRMACVNHRAAAAAVRWQQ